MACGRPRAPENPYRLARDIRGIGFKTADQIAMRLGIEKTALVRLRAGISHALAEAMDEGHCGLTEDELVPLAAKLRDAPAVPVESVLALELGDGTVVAAEVDERRVIFLAGLHRAERGIAERLAAIAAAPSPWPAIDSARAIPWVEQRAGIVLAESQRAAILRCAAAP